jgi:hypothetical protein
MEPDQSTTKSTVNLPVEPEQICPLTVADAPDPWTASMAVAGFASWSQLRLSAVGGGGTTAVLVDVEELVADEVSVPVDEAVPVADDVAASLAVPVPVGVELAESTLFLPSVPVAVAPAPG